jgi:hypothetical protein
MSRKFLYLPSDYKKRKNVVVHGRAKSGEISPKGLVAHTEDWEGRVKADVGPGAIRYIVEPDGRIRNMTMPEMLERGYFHLGKGPKGLRLRLKYD